MDVEAAVSRHVYHGLREDLSERRHHADVGGIFFQKSLQRGLLFRIFQAPGLQHRDPAL